MKWQLKSPPGSKKNSLLSKTLQTDLIWSVVNRLNKEKQNYPELAPFTFMPDGLSTDIKALPTNLPMEASVAYEDIVSYDKPIKSSNFESDNKMSVEAKKRAAELVPQFIKEFMKGIL